VARVLTGAAAETTDLAIEELEVTRLVRREATLRHQADRGTVRCSPTVHHARRVHLGRLFRQFRLCHWFRPDHRVHQGHLFRLFHLCRSRHLGHLCLEGQFYLPKYPVSIVLPE